MATDANNEVEIDCSPSLCLTSIKEAELIKLLLFSHFGQNSASQSEEREAAAFFLASGWTAICSEEGGRGSGVWTIDKIVATDANDNGVTIDCSPRLFLTSIKEARAELIKLATDNARVRIGTWNVGTSCTEQKAREMWQSGIFAQVLELGLSILFLQEVSEPAAQVFKKKLCEADQDWWMCHSGDCAVLCCSPLTMPLTSGKRWCAALVQSAFGETFLASYHAERTRDLRVILLSSLNRISAGFGNAIVGGDANAYRREVAALMPHASPATPTDQATSVTVRQRQAIDHIGITQTLLPSTSEIEDVRRMPGFHELIQNVGDTIPPVAKWCRKAPDHHLVWLDIHPSHDIPLQVDLDFQDGSDCEVDPTDLVGWDDGEDERLEIETMETFYRQVRAGNLRVCDPLSGDSLLIMAVEQEEPSIVRELLYHGAERNHRNYNSQTASLIANARDRVDLVDLIEQTVAPEHPPPMSEELKNWIQGFYYG